MGVKTMGVSWRGVLCLLDFYWSVREKVVRKGVKYVNEVFKELHQDYGQAETRIVADLINIFNTGKPQGVSELDEQIDVPQYLDEMSALQTRIRGVVPWLRSSRGQIWDPL